MGEGVDRVGREGRSCALRTGRKVRSSFGPGEDGLVWKCGSTPDYTLTSETCTGHEVTPQSLACERNQQMQ